MEKQYQVVLNIPAANGFIEIARFFVADTEQEAIAAFEQLEGRSSTHLPVPAIRFELVEHKDPLSNVIQVCYCSLDEAAENCKTLIKDIFRVVNLG